jgi:hypothetical protein
MPTDKNSGLKPPPEPTDYEVGCGKPPPASPWRPTGQFVHNEFDGRRMWSDCVAKIYGIGIVGAGVISTSYLKFAPLFKSLEIRAISDIMAWCGFRGHREEVFHEAGGWVWRGGY